MNPLPAPSTKHLGILHHALPTRDGVLALRQIAPDATDGEGTTGTTLWLGGQVLAAYLSSLRRAGGEAGTAALSSSAAPTSPSPSPAPCPSPSGRPTALELGAGIGFLSLSLAAAGYDVLSTDIEPVLSSVLAPNVAAGSRVLPAGSGRVTVHELDWMTSEDVIEADVIATADTVYAAHLVPHLWATIARLCRSAQRAPTLYLAIERRDPRMVDAALAMGREAGVELRRVSASRVTKAVERAYGWSKGKESGWEGVEVWKGRWRG